LKFCTILILNFPSTLNQKT